MTRRVATIWLLVAFANTTGCGKSDKETAQSEAEVEAEDRRIDILAENRVF